MRCCCLHSHHRGSYPWYCYIQQLHSRPHANTYQRDLLQRGNNWPRTIITVSALIFLLLGFCRPSTARAPLGLWAEELLRRSRITEDTPQMKFSSPSQETPPPFVFIILTSLFKELSSPASIRLSPRCSSRGPIPPHLFGAHPVWGAAMCFSHSSLPQKTQGGVGGDEERDFLT